MLRTGLSLRRHVDNAEGDVIRFVLEPAQTAEELHETLVLIGLAVLACTFSVARHLPNGDAVIGQHLVLQKQFQVKGEDFERQIQKQLRAMEEQATRG